ncbi:MAG: hypothetical protein R6U90_11335, partial [Thiohalophilus sp.]
PENPTIIDRIIEIIGADQVNYTGKTRCCGGPLLAMDEEVATRKMKMWRDTESVRASKTHQIQADA